VDAGREPGEIFSLEIDDLPARKIDDFSMHQLPTSNLLKELQGLCGAEVRIVSCQVETLPDSVSPGLSETVQKAVRRVGEMILETVKSHE
jgi:coenzyme F420 hydrogenase subunit delta